MDGQTTATVDAAFRSIPLDHLRPSTTEAQTQRRKYFDKAKLQELAESIAARGVLQPIVVRQLDGFAGASGHDPAYEIVAGERRFLASQIAKRETIQAVVLDLDDEGVIEVQLIENLQREDVHPMQEAEGYHELVHKYGHPIEEIYLKVGKSRSYVYGTMKLLALSKACRKAFYAGEIQRAVAEKIARMPNEKEQEEVLGWIKVESQYGSITFRDVAEHIAENYMLKLSEAPFTTDDATLVPAAGPCTRCPMRTGSQPELFSDIKSTDICTNAPCFHAKAKAHGARLLKEAAAKGQTVLTGADAKKLKGISVYNPKGGYVRLDAQVHRNGKTSKVKNLIPKGTDVALVDVGDGKVVQVVKQSALPADKRQSTGSNDSWAKQEAARRKKAELENNYRIALYQAMRPKLSAPAPLQLAHAVYASLDHEQMKRLWKIRGVELQESYGSIDRAKALRLVDEIDTKDLQLFMNDCIYVRDAFSYNGKGKLLEETAKDLKIDTRAIRASVAPKAKKKTKPAAKKKAKR